MKHHKASYHTSLTATRVHRRPININMGCNELLAQTTYTAVFLVRMAGNTGTLLKCPFHAYLVSLCICTHLWHYWQSLSVLSLNWLLGSNVQYVACTDSSLPLRLYLFIFARVIRNNIKQKWAEHFCAICSPRWQSLGVGGVGGKKDWFDACETPQENQYAHHNPRLT